MRVANPIGRHRPGIVRLAGRFRCTGGVGSLLRETLLLEILCGAASTPGQPRIPTSGIPIQSLLSGARVLVPATSLALPLSETQTQSKGPIKQTKYLQ